MSQPISVQDIVLMRKLNSELLNFWIDNAHNKTVFCISVSAQIQR